MSLLGLKCTDIIFSSGHTRARFEIEAVYDIGDSSQGSYLAKDYYKYFKDKYGRDIPEGKTVKYKYYN